MGLCRAGRRRRGWPGADGPAARGAAWHRRRHLAVLRRRRRSGHAPAAGQPRSGRRRAATYTSAANIGVYLWAVVAAHDLHLITPPPPSGWPTATLREVGHAQALRRLPLPVVRHHQRQRAAQPRRRATAAETHAGAGQLLVRLRGRQRLVRVRADRGPPGAPRRCAAWPTGSLSRRWTSRSSTTTAPRPTATPTRRIAGNQPTGQMYGGYYVDPAPPARPATTTARSTATRGSRCTSGWACTRCPATCGGAPGGRCRPQQCRHRP